MLGGAYRAAGHEIGAAALAGSLSGGAIIGATTGLYRSDICHISCIAESWANEIV